MQSSLGIPMDAKAMGPLGLALQAYCDGETDAELIICRDDGVEEALPARHFFRDRKEFTTVEEKAIELCFGDVLDVGAGTGLHSQVLQQMGLRVTAIDICPIAVALMQQRGVRDASCADVFTYQGGPFGSLLLLGHGIGMVETVRGLDTFLRVAERLVARGGQVLLDSMDVRCTRDPRHLAYHEANRRQGRYIGEIRLRLSFRQESGPECGWLHVDPEKLAVRADSAGWRSDVIVDDEDGHYLARLTKRPADH
jgi:SAM-dependent methyltransferase